MGYGKVAPAPVRSTDCAVATAEINAPVESATSMLRTVLITCDSMREVCRGSNSLGHVTGHHTLSKGFVTIGSRGVAPGTSISAHCSVREENSDCCSDAQRALGSYGAAMGLNE